MIKHPWVLIVAVCPKASDSQSEPNGLAVRRHGQKNNKAIANQRVCFVASDFLAFFPFHGHPS